MWKTKETSVTGKALKMLVGRTERRITELELSLKEISPGDDAIRMFIETQISFLGNVVADLELTMQFYLNGE